MPLLAVFMDSAEHYTRHDRKYKNAGTNSTAPASGVAGAHGLVCDDSVWGAKRFSFPASEKGSFRTRIRFRASSASNNNFLHVQSNSSNTHLQVRRNNDGTISVVGPAAVGWVHTTVDAYALDTWFDFEFRCRISNSGSYLLKMNGAIPNKSGGGLVAASGIDTQEGSDAFLICFFHGNETLDTYTDDTVMDAGGGNLGAGQVQCLYPNGVGDLSGLTPSALAPNWTLVDEAIQDDLTSYVESTADNQRDCYVFENVSISGSRFIVQVCGTMTHGASGNPTFHFRFFLRIDGENYNGEIEHNATTGWECFVECWNTNPATGDEWTEAEINSLQAGVLCEEDIKMTQLIVEVAALTPTPDFPGFRNYCGAVDSEIN